MIKLISSWGPLSFSQISQGNGITSFFQISSLAPIEQLRCSPRMENSMCADKKLCENAMQMRNEISAAQQGIQESQGTREPSPVGLMQLRLIQNTESSDEDENKSEFDQNMLGTTQRELSFSQQQPVSSQDVRSQIGVSYDQFFESFSSESDSSLQTNSLDRNTLQYTVDQFREVCPNRTYRVPLRYSNNVPYNSFILKSQQDYFYLKPTFAGKISNNLLWQ